MTQIHVMGGETSKAMFKQFGKCWTEVVMKLTVEDAELGLVQAAWNAFIGSDTAYFPRVSERVGAAIAKAKALAKDGKFDAVAQDELAAELSADDVDGEPEVSVDSDQIIFLIAHRLRALDLDKQTDEGLEMLRDHYRESLDESKSQTEYQDQKAARLLTIVSIFAAIGGVIIGKFIDYFPPRTDFGWLGWLIAASYLWFAAFLLSALTGAMVIFHASRTRYRWESTKSAKADKAVRSRLFHMQISKTRAESWADAVGGYLPKTAKVKPAKQIAADYLRDSVMEAYLVACKTNDKVRYLRPAQDWLSLSTKFFLGFLVFAVASLALVSKVEKPPESKPPPSTTSIQATSQSSATIAAPTGSPTSPVATGKGMTKP